MARMTLAPVTILMFFSLFPQTETVVQGAANNSVTNESGSTESSEISPLISAGELAELIKAKTEGLRVLEPGRKTAEFVSGHIATAGFIHWVDDMTDPDDAATYKNPDEAQFVELMSRLGINSSDRIVIYDRLSSRLSTRLYWTLKYFGHEKVQVLNGGIQAWETGYQLSKDKVEYSRSEYEVGDIQSQILAEMALVKEHLKKSSACLIDGRPEKQFSGEVAGKVFHTNKEHSRKGHIPGAVNVFWKNNFNDDGLFKSAEELTKLYQEAGVLDDRCVITYCNEGLHAAPPWFVLTEILGYENVRLYDSSMAEWSKTDEPMTTEKN
jgi:thiosulfate/3-mercaptopyruvate sulfurtransferase